MNPKFRLMPSLDYIDDAVETISKAQKRVYVISTILNTDSRTTPLLNSIKDAAKRGLEVFVVGDAYTFTEIGGHFRLNYQFSKRLKSVTRIRKDLEKSGAKFSWLGSDNFTLISGRTHTKWIIADDTVFSFGGVNLYKDGIESTDYMFKVKDETLADRLALEEHRLVNAVKNRHAYRSHQFGDDTTKVLVDGGFVGDSIIYRRACKLIKEASSVIFVSQYCPNGKLSRLLQKTDSTLYFNPWNQAKSLNALYIRIAGKLSGNKTTYKRKPYIHCKFIICTMADGSKVAITGSHNFASGGVWLGTREIALETRDPHIIEQLEQFVVDYLA